MSNPTWQEKQYQILGADGLVAGCVWADKVDADGPAGASRFFMRGTMIASAWFGYREYSAGVTGPIVGRAA